MIEELRIRLDGLRASVRLARAASRALRWTFGALLLVCAALVARKFLDLAIPDAAVAALLALPLLPFLLEIRRRFTIGDCAALVDRRFKLEERVSTAVETTGGFGPVLAADALKAIRGVDLQALRRVRWPRETPFLAIAGIVALALWAVPAPERAEGGDPALRSAAREERRRLLAPVPEHAKTKDLAAELESVAALLEKGDPESIRLAVERLHKVEEAAGARMLSAEGDELAALREIADRASGSGTALSRALAAEGHGAMAGNTAPKSVIDKLGKSGVAGGTHGSDRPPHRESTSADSAGVPSVEAREAARRRMERRDWPPEYDAAVRNYFSE